MIPTIHTFERLTRSAIKENGKESLLAYIKSEESYDISNENATIWKFFDWIHVEITTSLYVLYLYPSGKYLIDYIGSSPNRREEEGYIDDDSILHTLLNLI